MFCSECGNYAANKALRKLGVRTENNSLSWDGNTEGKLVVADYAVRVSTKPFDLAQVESISVKLGNNSADVHVGDGLFLAKGEPLSSLVQGDGTPFVLVCTEEHYNEQYGTTIPVGVYFIATPEFRVAAIKCTETIHPIDQKYLPGVCLPVVELSTTFASGANFTAEENAKLKAAWEAGTPVVIKIPVSVGSYQFDETAAVWTRIHAGSGTNGILSFAYSFGGTTITILSINSGNTWMCSGE